MKGMRFLLFGLAAACGAAWAADAPEEAPAADAPRYEIVPWTNGWHAAKADAEARGGHLAAITGGEEWLAVTRSFPPEELAGCWLGATDEKTEGVWKWVTGEPWGYARWGAGEPNNDRGNADGCENFLEIKGEPVLHWNDCSGRGTEKTKYLLEREDGDGKTLSSRIPRKCGTPSRRRTAAATAPGELVHRWSFNGDLADSVGGRDAVFSGSAAHSWSADGKSVSLPGGPWGTSALCLGKDVVPSDGTPVTIELWATQRQMQHQSRIFELASRPGNGFYGDFMEMTWSWYGHADGDEIWIWEAEPDNGGKWSHDSPSSKWYTSNALAPYEPGKAYHVSLVLEPDGDGRTFLRFAKRDAASGEILKQTNGWVSGGWTPARLAGREMWLGRSSFHPDRDAAADYDEVRIWNAVLTDGELSRNARLGPDVLPGGACVKEKQITSGNLSDGLVAYWPFDGDAKDASGNGNDGVVHGVEPVADRNGKARGAFHFGGNATVTVSDSASLRNVTDAFSVAAWVKYDKPCTTPLGDWLSILAKGTVGRQFGLNFHLTASAANNTEIGLFQHAAFGTFPPRGEWAHVAATFDANGLSTAYVNGKAVGTWRSPHPLSVNREELVIGSDPHGDVEYLVGALDDVVVWNRALSAEEVARLAAGEKPATEAIPARTEGNLSAGLVAYWPFDGDAKDASGNGNDGVAHGVVPTADRNGKKNGAYHFRGHYDGGFQDVGYIEVADSASLSGITRTVTIAAWIKPEAWCPGDGTIASDPWLSILCKGRRTRQFCIQIGSKPAPKWVFCDNTPDLAVSTLPPLGQWTHVALTDDGKTLRAYQNGWLAGSAPSAGHLPQTMEALYIGMDRPGGLEYFTGAMDDVAVWNRALSAEEVARLAAGEKPLAEAATAGKGRYEIVPWTRGWEAARTDAEARGGHLATITSEEEWETIRNLFPLRDLLGCWLGASDAEEEGVWQWVTGEPWGFTRWAPDQPDAMREGQDYLWLHVNFAGHWDDIEGDDPGATKYLLEREGPPISVSGLRQPFRLSPHLLLVEAAGGTNEVEVAAEGVWAAAERVPWISLKHAHGNGPGRLAVKVAANESPAKRSAKVRVRTTWDGEWRDIAVEQRGMEQVAMPRIRSRGGTFEGPKQRVVLSCATEGASIRYTLDGSDPDGTSPLYAGSFNLSATATVKARAFKDGMLPSGLAEASFARRTSLAEAIGMPEGIVSTDRFTGWRVEEGAGREGGPAAKSGAIGPEGRSRMEVRIEGAGTVAFWWKASCEDDLDGTGWDRVAFSVDGLEKAALDGESGWQRVEAEVKGEGVHVLAWEYAKDWIDEKPTADAAWVEGVSWRPATKRQVRSKE